MIDNALHMLQAAAEPQPRTMITWADVLAAVPTNEQHLAKARSRGSVTMPVIYSYETSGRRHAVLIIERNAHAIVTENAETVRVSYRRGPYNGGVGAELPSFGQPRYFLLEGFRTPKELLKEILVEFHHRAGTRPGARK